MARVRHGQADSDGRICQVHMATPSPHLALWLRRDGLQLRGHGEHWVHLLVLSDLDPVLLCQSATELRPRDGPQPRSAPRWQQPLCGGFIGTRIRRLLLRHGVLLCDPLLRCSSRGPVGVARPLRHRQLCQPWLRHLDNTDTGLHDPISHRHHQDHHRLAELRVHHVLAAVQAVRAV
jgi:hypothetical protein